MAIKFLSGQTISGTLTVSGNVQGATFNSLAINTTGTNNVANQIVRTQANGYVNFGWINSVSGNHTGSITRITASNDAYLRYVTPAQFRTGVTDGFYAPASTVTGVTSVATGNGLTGGTITSTGTLTMSGSYTGDFSVTGFTTSTTGFGINYVAGATVPMVILANATNYGIFYREASPDYIEFKHGGVVKQSFDGSGNVDIEGNLTLNNNIFTAAGALTINNPLDTNSNLIIAGRYDLGATTLSFRSGHGGNSNVWDMATILVEDDTNYNGRILFRTSPSGYGNTPTTKMTIRSSGAIAFGTGISDYGSSGQVLKSNGNASPTWVDASTVSGVTSVATTNGISGGTITSTGTIQVDSTVIRTTGDQSITGNTTFYPSSTSTGYSVAAIELMASSSGTSGTPPRISWHWGGVVASLITIEANGTIAVRNNPGNAYEQFKASTITATSSMLSPIYYDSNNSNYYGDFASTSVFNKLNTGIGNLGTSRSVSYSMTTGNWYRIASGAGRSCGDIYIQDAISGGPHGNITFYAGSSYSQYAGTMLKLKSSSFYNVIGFTEIRLLIGTTYQDQFVEIYCQRTGTYNITVQDTHYATNNWVLSASATVGSVPTGYSDSTRLDINGMLIAEAGNGSNRFAVDRVGAIHLSGGTSGSSGQVLTSGGTGSPTWTTLQNQTGGPFLPLAGGTMTGLLQINTSGSSAAGNQLKIYSTTNHQYPQIHSNAALEAMWNYKNSSVEWYVGIRTSTQLLGNTGFHFYNTTSGQTVGGWDVNGNSYSIGSSRAPIFYDSNNTAYYLDPASTSNLNGLTVAGTITGTIASSNKLAITGYQTNGQSFYQSSGSFAGFSGWHNYYIGNHGNGSNYYNTTIAFPFWSPPRYSRLENNTLRGPYNFLTNEVDQTIGVYLQSTTSLRAPIFYDYNNTAFYLDPSTTGTSVNVAGDVVAYASSDIRFKNNIIPITNALDKLSKIGGYTFEWNEISHKETGKKDIGVVAQEVEEILPEIVQTRSNGYKAVDYQKLTALLIESVKEQQVIINDLKTRIERLEKI